MNYEGTKQFLSRIGQEQLLQYYEELDGEKRSILLEEIEKVNFSVVQHINKNESAESSGTIKPLNAVDLRDIARNHATYENEGLKLLKANKVAAVLLAGGQGTRLGFSKPKGMYDMGVTRPKSIFSLLMDNVKEVAAKAGNCFHLFIMTSSVNHEDTVRFFRQNGYFGYPSDKIHFYIQDTEPTCDFEGKIFLADKHRVSLSPNGNGGWYSSLKSAKLNKIIESEGIEWLNVFGVDNVLQKICDPAFIGATSLSGNACGSKVVKKTCPEERVGVLCERNGKPAIVEYYEMPAELAAMRDGDGELTFRYGVILNYLFKVDALEQTLSEKLPYHLAVKAIPHMQDGEYVQPGKPNGYKFETLVVDLVSNMGGCLAYEVVRENEFAPVKNKTGADSVDSARQLLLKNGIKL